MIEHTREFIDALEFKFPGYMFIFLFDWSSGHAKYPKGAPNVNSMNVNFGGKQEAFRPAEIQQEFTYPENFPPNLRKLGPGMFQSMVFQEGDSPPFYKPTLSPAQYVGKPKGMKQVLFERGLFVQGMTENGSNGQSEDGTSMKFVLSECIDFKTQKTALQEFIEGERGHVCEFLPKYHPELSAIERCWAIAKKYMRGRCRFNFKDMLKKVLKALVDPEIQPISMIRKFFRKGRDYMRVYIEVWFEQLQGCKNHFKTIQKPP